LWYSSCSGVRIRQLVVDSNLERATCKIGSYPPEDWSREEELMMESVEQALMPNLVERLGDVEKEG
jgi:hypothetical protein